MTCEELYQVLHDYVGGALVVEIRTTVEVHISGCDHCGVLVHSYSHTVRVGRALPRCGLPPAFEARLRAVIEPELNGEKPTG